MGTAARILVVDDDPAIVEHVAGVLRRDGFDVVETTQPTEALSLARSRPPDLVLSDVRMPDLSGLDLQRAYREARPDRDTPFVFLSSLGDPATIVRGLELGADDFLVKPVAPEVLCAKVRVVLRRAARRRPSSYAGDLSAIGVPALLRFCETKGLTGSLDFTTPDGTRRLRFDGGRLDEHDANAHLDAILEAPEARFELKAEPVDLGELEARASSPGTIEAVRTQGRVSSYHRQHRTLTVQTELVTGAEPSIVTLVALDGRTQWKQRTPVDRNASAQELQAGIDAQHRQIERQLETKVAAALSAARPTEEEVGRLCDLGYDRFRAGDHVGAIAAWESALELDPSRKSIEVNLGVARRRCS